MKIVLLRHGKPDFFAHWLNADDDPRSALERYEASRVTGEPSPELHALKASVTLCVSSKLSRASDSARLLGFSNPVESELFNESVLPYPDRLLVPMTWNVFLLVYRLSWLCGYRKNCAGKSNDRERAVEAARHLSALASESDSVMLVGHGIMNRLICTELRNTGWSVSARDGSGYWSSITLTH